MPDASLNLVRTVSCTHFSWLPARRSRGSLCFYQVLRLALPGFRASTKAEKSKASRTRRSSHTPAASPTVGVLEFEYEVKCASKCQLLLVEASFLSTRTRYLSENLIICIMYSVLCDVLNLLVLQMQILLYAYLCA